VEHEEEVLVQRKMTLKMTEKIKRMKTKNLMIIQNQMVQKVRIKIQVHELVIIQNNQIEK
jgi:hypothetical protein